MEKCWAPQQAKLKKKLNARAPATVMVLMMDLLDASRTEARRLAGGSRRGLLRLSGELEEGEAQPNAKHFPRQAGRPRVES